MRAKVVGKGMKMGFHDEELFPEDALPGRLPAAVWKLRMRLRRWLRAALGRIGLPSSPGLDERMLAGAWEGILREQRWEGAWTPDQVLAWLDEAVLRAPAPGGFDEQIIGLAAIREGRVIDRRFRLVDKYGYRRSGREKIRGWLEEIRGRGEVVEAGVLQPALLRRDASAPAE